MTRVLALPCQALLATACVRGLAVLAAAVLVSGCAARSYAVINGRAGASAPFDVSSVLITGIDGRADFDGWEHKEVAPGFHAIQVMTRRKVTRDSRAAQLRPIPSSYVYVTAEPCMEYYIIARHDSGAEDSPWHAEVERSERITGCESGPRPPG
jgi:hypothetical protein